MLKNPHVVFLSETKLQQREMDFVHHPLCFQNCFTVNSVGRRGGLALLWDSSVGFSLLSFSTHHINGWIDWNGLAWQLTGFYGFPDRDAHHLSWSLLRQLHGDPNTPWLVSGDFNAILNHSQKDGGRLTFEGEIDAFQQVLDECSLMDLGFVGELFTWKNRRAGRETICECLDRVVCTSAWHQLIILCLGQKFPKWFLQKRLQNDVFIETFEVVSRCCP